MKRLDYPELAAWCEISGYSVAGGSPILLGPEYRGQIQLPDNPHALPGLIDDLVALGTVETEMVIWISEWNIWNDRSQDIGLRHLTLLVDGYVDTGSDGQPHIYLLPPPEWRETIALLTVPLLYGWDAYLFFHSGAALVEVSHDGYVDVSLRRRTALSRLDGWDSSEVRE